MQTKHQTATSKQIDDDQLCFPPLHRLPEQPRTPSEGENLQRVGNTEELRAFMTRYADAIHRSAKRLSHGSEENASEVLQELYPRLIAVPERSPDGLRNPWAVVRRVAARLDINCHRRSIIRQRRFKELPEAVVDRRTESNPNASAVHAAIGNLPPRCKTIVLGIFIERCRAKNLAARMNLSASRLSELKQEALLTLRDLLGGDAA